MADVDHSGNWNTRRSAVQSKMSSGNYKAALEDGLRDPPFNCKDAKIVDESAALIGTVLAQIKGPEMAKTCDSLDDTQKDTLMKYIYKAMATGENANSLLAWHGALSTAGGIGTVVRALADRKNLG